MNYEDALEIRKNVNTYRKKPVEIQAIQLVDNSQYMIKKCLEFMGQEVNISCDMASQRFDEYCESVKENGLIIHTLEGDMIASIGDFIIKGVNGEFYPCKPDIFCKTYEYIE